MTKQKKECKRTAYGTETKTSRNSAWKMVNNEKEVQNGASS